MSGNFKKCRGIKLPYKKQGLICFTCLTFREQPAAVQEKIRRICAQVGGADYGPALFQLLTTEKSVRTAALEHAVSESQLYRLRKAFYESW